MRFGMVVGAGFLFWFVFCWVLFVFLNFGVFLLGFIMISGCSFLPCRVSL